jgi:hypothetical protein
MNVLLAKHIPTTSIITYDASETPVLYAKNSRQTWYNRITEQSGSNIADGRLEPVI